MLAYNHMCVLYECAYVRAYVSACMRAFVCAVCVCCACTYVYVNKHVCVCVQVCHSNSSSIYPPRACTHHSLMHHLYSHPNSCILASMHARHARPHHGPKCVYVDPTTANFACQRVCMCTSVCIRLRLAPTLYVFVHRVRMGMPMAGRSTQLGQTDPLICTCVYVVCVHACHHVSDTTLPKFMQF